MRTLFFFCLAIAAFGCVFERNPIQYVNPFIGTDATHFISEWRSEGCTYPGAVAPHGMVQITPETSAPGDYLRGYYYFQDTIRQFSLVEHYSGWPDGSQGKGMLMPFSLPEETEADLNQAKSAFSHEREEAQPGYYAVYLDDSRIACTFAASTRAAIGRFSFEGTGNQGLILGGGNTLTEQSDRELAMTIPARSGYFGAGQNDMYLHFSFDQPFVLREAGRYYMLTFPKLAERGQLTFKYGASYTSAGNAATNLYAEIPGWSLEEVRRQAEALWNEELGRVEVVKGREEEKTIFYTALYHGALLPINATDINGQYPGFEDNEPLQPGETHYIYYTPWDAFRSLHPWVNLVHPDKGRDYMRSLVRTYRSGGQLPEPQVMTGVHLSSLFADALAKGIDDFDVEMTYRGLSELILEPPYFRPDMAWYDSLGYVPSPHRYATTATLEFAFNDWALAQVARHLGKEELAEQLTQRSLNYQNNYRPETRFMESRNYDGSWADAPIYAEANRWNMSWFAPHDVRGLINLMGGDEAFCEHLDRNFREGHFVLDNECPMNFPFLFSYAGQPWKTMEWKSKTLQYFFNATPGGIPGNDDWGSLSSWYAWSVLGFFPASPGTEELIIAGPVFEEVVLRLPGGKKVTLEAENASAENIYIQECRVDGERYDRPYIRQSDLLGAEKIYFRMGARPNREWGLEGAPYSVTRERPQFEVLSLSADRMEVRSHEEFFLDVQLRNSGAPGSYPLKIRKNGRGVDSTFILLQTGETKTVRRPLRLYEGGPAALSVADQSVTVQVSPVELPAEEALMALAVDLPALVPLRDSIPWRATIKNISGRPVEAAPVLYLDGAPAGTLPVLKLQPGENAEMQGMLAPITQTGFHELAVQHSPAGRFKVYEKPEETLVLHYTFDEQGDRVMDHSGFDNHGEIIGELEYVEGIKGRGIKVEKGFVQVPESLSLTIEDEELTMICWYKPGPKNGKSSLITKGGHNMMKLNGKWQLQLAIGGWGVGQCNYNAPYDAATGEPAWLGQWSHFAGTRADDRLHVFYNGKMTGQLPVKGRIGHTGFKWRVGSNAEIPIGRTPDGVIDEVMIFARALSVAEVRAIYAGWE